ncbi:MAG TPA: HypC/HybG/HupF family hydrogenase formation chaperone [Phycisphaerae bacterium]|nr:HypC/HybG/HupF family hydrogenase formation chaperone [Phycisphaerae bacterium]HOJ73793.1 HypC/HybG/HupF family hydrogenase formation chaperone [Phycisphaerae bacterium]HOM50440.1 HypC/HybG/HupF family hydrogenase formation chaperone [Phycisphaerae bacterium]HON65431.1 HypC/HybG/HupF family hydrogenase formation chaperone [Phycisphaerae bacterium]HOQ85704.1 HypC/HybG/HupF family hydrogenase formation chaperone [Phycisphaerae bacterium]
MCLAVPGKIVEIKTSEAADATGAVGTVDFQGSRLDVSLAFVPEAKPGDWVLVHAGFALNVLDEQEAAETWKYLSEAELAELPDEMKARKTE